MMNFMIGVLATIVGAGLIKAWPAVQDRLLYKGIRIAGTWEIVEEQRGKHTKTGQIHLKQCGRIVSGSSTRSKDRGGKKINRNFNYNGHIDGQQVTLLFEDVSGIGFDAGSYIFIVHNDGLSMKGMATFHGKVENKIISEERQLKKIPS